MDFGVLSSMHLNKMQLGDHGIVGLNWVEGTICSILLLLFYLGTIPGYAWGDQTRVSDTGFCAIQGTRLLEISTISSGGCSPTP